MNSWDVLLLLFSALLLPFFYFIGTGILYQWIIGSLVGLFLYLMTDVFVNSFTFGNDLNFIETYIVSHKQGIQSLALTFTWILLIFCPFSSILRITPMGANVFWRFSRTIIYSVIFLFYFWAIIGIVIYGPPPFNTNNFFTNIRWLSWWQTTIEPSSIFAFARQHAFTIVFLGISYVILKILFSRILYKLFFIMVSALSAIKANPSMAFATFSLKAKTRDEVIYHDEPEDQ